MNQCGIDQSASLEENGLDQLVSTVKVPVVTGQDKKLFDCEMR